MMMRLLCFPIFRSLLVVAGCVYVSAALRSDTGDCNGVASVPSVHCGITPTATFDTDGKLRVVFTQGDTVYVSSADGPGNSFSAAVAVNSMPEPVEAKGESRPKIATGPKGEIYIAWTRGTHWKGDVRFSRSLDGGRSFDEAVTINDDGQITGHAFETLGVNTNGDVYIAWLDKRDAMEASARGGDYKGAALYYTVSVDQGASFVGNRKVADSSCECCRISVEETPEGDIAVFWRHIFGDNVRDHGFAVLGRDGVRAPVQRATVDNWRIEACPHHGPAMVSAGEGGYHLTWFTNSETRKGIFYGLYHSATGQISEPVPMATTAAASHPYIAATGRHLLLVWKEFDGKQTHIHLAVSNNAGLSWSSSRRIATTDGASDHPFLISHDNRVWLSWHTAVEGLRIIPTADFTGTIAR